MGEAFSWIGDIVRAILQFVPRLVIIRATHKGVKWRRGRRPVEMKPGLRIYWPLVSEIEIIVAARQTDNLAVQALTTKDGQPISVGGFVVYSISDVVRAIGETNWDVASTVKDIASAAIVEVILGMTMQEILDGARNGQNGRLHKELTKACRRQLRQYGVSVRRCGLTDLAACRVYRLLGNEVK